MPAIYHEGSWLGNATDPEVLVKDTVGWTGKNLLKNTATTQTVNGITFTVNADKSVTANGTATANTVFPLNLAIKSKLEENGKYILSGCPSGGATNKYKLDFRTVTASSSTDAIYNDIGEGATFTLTNAQYSSYELGVAIRIENGATVNNLIFYPMLRKADITDPTYEPYHESVQNQLNAQGVLGAKNFLNPTYAGGTVNGVTITANSNKTYELNGVPSSGNMAVAIYTGTFPVGRYILNGVSDFATYGARLHIRETAGASQVDAIDTGKGIEFTIPSATTSYSVFMYLNSGYMANNLIIKPMIRLASDPDDTYQPYAMTNRELTEKVFEKRTLTSADDLNNITETGIYGVTSAPLNSPESTSYYTLIVQKTSDSDIRQTIFKGGYIYHRYYGGSPISWKSWYKFTGTVVS